MATPAASRRTLQETVAALQTLCKTEKGSVLSEETRSLVVELKRSLLRHATSSHAFNASGGPQLLLQLLSQCACSVQDAGLLLGVLANICALDKNCRDSVSYYIATLNLIFLVLFIFTPFSFLFLFVSTIINNNNYNCSIMILNIICTQVMREHSLIGKSINLLIYNNYVVVCSWFSKK